jgi:hypothetical protein
MLKKILIICAFVSLFVGCKSNQNVKFDDANYKNDNKIILSSDFNKDHYIWENWQFSTNRVDQK